MKEKSNALRKELNDLVRMGDILLWAMADEIGTLGDENKKILEKNNIKLPSFGDEYDRWYSVALRVVKQVIPDRLDDFIAQYKDDKRKKIDFVTYTISDYLLGVRSTLGARSVADTSAALPKMKKQVSILKSAENVFDSIIADLREVLQADLFDSELDAAAELGRRGFVRGGGAIAGVVIEKHLAHVCELHGLKTRKKNPTINDFNQMLKEADIIDTSVWRFIQHLGDLRNLCDHPKDREPTRDDIVELVEGVKKVSRTVT